MHYKIDTFINEYKSLSDIEKVVFWDYINDITLAVKNKNQKKPIPFEIKRYFQKQEVRTNIQMLYNIAVKKRGVKAVNQILLNTFVSFQRMVFGSYINSPNIKIVHIRFNKESYFIDELNKKIENKEVNYSRIFSLRKSFTQELIDKRLFEKTRDENIGEFEDYFERIEERRTESVLDKLIYEFYMNIEKEFGKEELEKGIQELESLEGKLETVRFENRIIEEIYNIVKLDFDDSRVLSYDSKTFSIFYGEEKIHSFKTDANNRAIVTKYLFSKPIVSKIYFKDLMHELDKTYQRETLDEKNSKMIRKAISDINEIIKSKTKGKIEKTFSVKNDGTHSYILRTH